MIRCVAEQISQTDECTVIQRAFNTAGMYEIVTEVWTPKAKFFRPPCNRFFMWAYDVERSQKWDPTGSLVMSQNGFQSVVTTSKKKGDRK